jgi:hypothetical protein
MKSTKEIIEDLAGVEVSVKCEKCGTVLQVVGRQYSVRCHRCGTYITLTSRFLAKLKQLEYRSKYGDLEVRYKCGICQDSGVVILEEQVDDQLAQYVYRCLCQAGQRREEKVWPLVPAAKVVSQRSALFADAEQPA